MNNYKQIKPYLTDLRTISRTPAGELDRLVSDYHLTGSINARDGIINYFLPIIPQLMARYIDKGVDIADLIQEGNIKLIELIELIPADNEHEYKRGGKGIDITQGIKGYIVRAINNHIHSVLKKARRRQMKSINYL